MDGSDMLIDGECIVALGRGLAAAGAEVIDGTGCIATPGLQPGLLAPQFRTSVQLR